MAVPSTAADLSTTAASNSPAGTESIGTSLDDYMRAFQAILKQENSIGANIASGTTITVPSAGKYFIVTGVTTITGINDSWTGRTVFLKFSGALTLTHSASLILPRAVNISTAAGDVIGLCNESTGVWRCTFFQPASGYQPYDADTTKNDTANSFTAIQKWAKGADIASAGALALGTDGNYFDVTGTTSITSIGTAGIGVWVRLHFDDVLTLTHHATDLILPGGANITTAAGDEAEFIEYASGDWRCVSYTKAAGTPVVGSGVTLLTATATTSGTSKDFNIPTGAKEITISFAGVSLSGSSDLLVQIGDAGGFETTGYVSSTATATGDNSSTAGFVMRLASASNVAYGHMLLSLVDAAAFQWVSSHSARVAATTCTTGGGDKSLSAELTQVRITTVNGTDTFDAGKVNVSYKL